MLQLQRSPHNPILIPDSKNAWEKEGAFNASVCLKDNTYLMVYRALSQPQFHHGFNMKVSSIGYATSVDGVHFENKRQIITPEKSWELFGCEDPRITYLEGKYYIFYTTLSHYPFVPYGITIGVALTSDFTHFEKHPVTFFNSKAMALFPKRVNGKLAAVLTVHTDNPPAKIALALFDKEEDLWSKDYWDNWYTSLNEHVISMLKSTSDQVEVGASPVETPDGWLLIYSYIQNYFTPNRTFGIRAALLDANKPTKVLARIDEPLLVPQKDYEINGNVPNVTFPSGALVKNDTLLVYYGAADTASCLTTCDVYALQKELKEKYYEHKLLTNSATSLKLNRFSGNPIITPIPEIPWESRATFNPAAFIAENTVHIVYRAMSDDGTSTLGYATSTNGYTIDERLVEPVYTPREQFEKKSHELGNSGCEDPRITQIGDTLYMCYTSYDGKNPPRVALTSLALSDFLAKRWQWKKPILISPPGTDDKNACLFPKKIHGKYIVFHRIGVSIWIDMLDSLDFLQGKWLGGNIFADPRPNKWDNLKIGVSAPPIETHKGFLLLYHGVSEHGTVYKLGAMLLDSNDPMHIIARTDEPILSPEEPYEKVGEVPNVVFPCGAVVLQDQLFVYYGSADKVIGVATMPLEALLSLF